MARISGIDLSLDKSIWIALTSIYGIGRRLSMRILEKAEVTPLTHVKDLTENEISAIREEIGKGYRIEGDLKGEVQRNIKRLVDIGCYRGIRHRRGLPCRGQRTHTNARTHKGHRRAVGGRKGK